MPASLADPGPLDHVEVVEVASGEVLLSWDLPPMRAARLARALRADLSQLDPAELPRAMDRRRGRRRGDRGPRRSESDSWV